MNRRVSVEKAMGLLKEYYDIIAEEVKEVFGYDEQNFIVTEKLKDKCNRYVLKVIQNTESNRKGQ